MGTQERQSRRGYPDGAEPAQEQIGAIAILWEIELAAEQAQPNYSRRGPSAIQAADELGGQQD